MTALDSPAPDGTVEAPTRVLLVDDHELIRGGLATVLSLQPDLEVVGEAGTVVEALALAEELRPAVVVTDLQLPDGTGLDVVRAIRRHDTSTGLVILTMHSGDEQIFAALEAGASAFVGKDAPSTEVVQATQHAARAPGTFICTGLSEAMIRRMSGETNRLSDREHEVLVLLADGLGAGQIAAKLFMSESTAKSHITRIYHKLGATNRAQALVTAMRSGLLSTMNNPSL